MASARLPQELALGTILWIKELTNSNDGENHDLPPKCFKHPCVIVNLAGFKKGSAQIYVVRAS
jgi:hypothetical protein